MNNTKALRTEDENPGDAGYFGLKLENYSSDPVIFTP